MPRCRLRGLLLSVFTIRSSTRVQVNIYALTFVPCMRLIIWEMNFSSVQTCLLPTPYFVIFRPQLRLDLRAADKRAYHSLLIGYLKPA
jgi:hypothetical protein